MKTRYTGITLSLFGAISLGLLVGCTSVPAGKSANDTLVVLPGLGLTTRIGTIDAEVGYTIYLENVSNGKIVPIDVSVNNIYGYKFVKGIPAGQYSIKEYGAHGLVNSPNKPLSFKNNVIVEAGKMTILPVKIVSIIFTSETDDRPTFYIDFQEIEENQKQRILTVLQKDEKLKPWMQ